MDPEKIKVYLSAVDLGTLTAAAEAMGYTTSGVSRSIASMEEELGISLLSRCKKGVNPTAEALELIPMFRDSVSRHELIQDKARQLQGLEIGTVTIGVSYPAFFRILAKKAKEFSFKHPGIDIKFVQHVSTEMLNLLDTREIDFAIMTKRVSNYRFIQLLEDPMVACVAKSNPLAQHEAFPLELFGTEPMVAAYPKIETDFRNALERHGIMPNIKYSAEDIYAAYCMVESDLGVSLSNRLEVSYFEGDVALLPTDPPVAVEIGVTHPDTEQMTHASRAFLKHLLEAEEK